MLNKTIILHVTCDACEREFTLLRNTFYFDASDTADVIAEVLNNHEWFSSEWEGVLRQVCEACAKCDRCGESAWDSTEDGEFLCESHMEGVDA